MPIHALPQFEADLEEDRKIYERLKPPTSIVVRFGIMKLVGEFPYSGDAKPGCGSKMVIRSQRGIELGEMLTSTCPNSGCSKSVSRKEMLEYIENSGGRDYPFFTQGKVMRIATVEDLNEQTRLEGLRPQMTRSARNLAERMGLKMKVVDAEPILGGDRITFYFTSEDRIDFRELVNTLAAEHRTRIEMREVGARDEARLVADYEKCGQHCCCKQFLKVLKPVSMKSAKIQKATLDPLKISGRCGRLMCCLRYEDETYDELRARLPKKKTRVDTGDGLGTVLDTQILTQLCLIKLDSTGEEVAIALEELTLLGKDAPPAPPPPVPYGQPGGRGGPGPGGGPSRGPRPPDRQGGSGAPSGPPRADAPGAGASPPPRPDGDRRPDRGDRRDGGRGGDGRGANRGGGDSSGRRHDGPRGQQPAAAPAPMASGVPARFDAEPLDADPDGPEANSVAGAGEGATGGEPSGPDAQGTGEPGGGGERRRRRRRRRRGSGGGGGPNAPDAGGGAGGGGGGAPSGGGTPT